jgi:hypothetical protein
MQSLTFDEKVVLQRRNLVEQNPVEIKKTEKNHRVLEDYDPNFISCVPKAPGYATSHERFIVTADVARLARAEKERLKYFF